MTEPEQEYANQRTIALAIIGGWIRFCQQHNIDLDSVLDHFPETVAYKAGTLKSESPVVTQEDLDMLFGGDSKPDEPLPGQKELPFTGNATENK